MTSLKFHNKIKSIKNSIIDLIIKKIRFSGSNEIILDNPIVFMSYDEQTSDYIKRVNIETKKVIINRNLDNEIELSLFDMEYNFTLEILKEIENLNYQVWEQISEN